jgi:hypothetical protein
MATQKIPLDNSPNQTFQCTLTVGSRNITLSFKLCYNEMAGYWCMTITDPITGSLILDSIPLITGQNPAANILEPHAYLDIGSAFIVNVSGSPMDFPDDTNLGTDFVLIWGETLPV